MQTHTYYMYTHPRPGGGRDRGRKRGGRKVRERAVLHSD